MADQQVDTGCRRVGSTRPGDAAGDPGGSIGAVAVASSACGAAAEVKVCAFCGKALPAGCKRSRRYCDGKCGAYAYVQQRYGRLPQSGVDRRPRWERDPELAKCRSCGGQIERKRLVNQGGRTKFCGGCAKKETRLRMMRNKAAYKQAPSPCVSCGLSVPKDRIAHRLDGSLTIPARFCSETCQRQRYGGMAASVPASSIGALHELRVGADLLQHGYEVFRSLSPAASCDLLAMRDGEILRVEVRSINRTLRGKLQSAPVKARDRGRFDVLAMVEYNGNIHYCGLDREQ